MKSREEIARAVGTVEDILRDNGISPYEVFTTSIAHYHYEMTMNDFIEKLVNINPDGINSLVAGVMQRNGKDAELRAYIQDLINGFHRRNFIK